MKMSEHRPSIVSWQRPPSYGGAPPDFRPAGDMGGMNASRGISIRMTGILQVVLGLASIVTGLIAIFLECYLSYYAVPVWAGMLFFGASGIVGIRAYYKKMSKGTTIAYMAMSICNAVLAGILFVMYINVAMEESYSYYCYSYEQCRAMRVRVIIDILIALLCFSEMAVAITGSGLTCCRICHCCTPGQSGVNMVYYNTQTGAGQTSIPQYGQHEGQTASYQGGAVETGFTAHQSATEPQPTNTSHMTGGVDASTSASTKRSSLAHAHFETPDPILQAAGEEIERVTV